jgi:glycosyltransferase involved in cell wall biosynthesis
MTSPLVSIIIPVYNRALLIAETLRSVQSQTYAHWECILVDDGSTDDSMAVVTAFAKADQRIHIYQRPDTLVKGADACRNYGFAQSKGTYINWFDSDDLMLPLHLEKKVNALLQNEKLDASFCFNQSFEMKQADQQLGAVNSFRKENLLEDLILRKQFVQTGCGLWRKKYLEKQFVNEAIFDELLSQSQDYDFYARIFLREPEYVILNEPLFLFRRGNDSISTSFTSQNSKHIASYLRARSKILIRHMDSPQIQKGVLNTILSSWNMQLHSLDKKAFNAYISVLNESRNVVVPAFAKAIPKAIRWAKFIRFLGKGAYRFRDKFKVE